MSNRRFAGVIACMATGIISLYSEYDAFEPFDGFRADSMLTVLGISSLSLAFLIIIISLALSRK